MEIIIFNIPIPRVLHKCVTLHRVYSDTKREKRVSDNDNIQKELVQWHFENNRTRYRSFCLINLKYKQKDFLIRIKYGNEGNNCSARREKQRHFYFYTHTISVFMHIHTHFRFRNNRKPQISAQKNCYYEFSVIISKNTKNC